MSIVQEIAKAIGAHGIWKARLNAAIESDRRDFDIAEVGCDHVCAFGQWLHGPTITSEMRGTVEYIAVVQLHSHFHRCAARVLKYVSIGASTSAKVMMAPDGEYSAMSSQLVAAMVQWKDSIKVASYRPPLNISTVSQNHSDCFERLNRSNQIQR